MRFAPRVGFIVLFLVAGSSVSLADIHYYPTDGTLATWAFEDNWSKKGDFDFNDVVIRYSMKFTTTVYNEATVVTEAKFRMQLVARGAQFKSGFAISLPISRTGVTATLGCEDAKALPVPDGDPDNTVYVVIPDVSAVLDGGCAFYNTEDPNCGGDGTEFTLTVTIPPENGVNKASLEMGVNPFIFRVGEEGREVHLAGFEPSATAILSSIGLFRTEDDDTECTPASGTCTELTGHYYLTANDLPWALDIPTEWIWPLEQVDVTSAYKDFGSWAASYGRDDGDWFTSHGEAGTTWDAPINVNGQCRYYPIFPRI